MTDDLDTIRRNADRVHEQITDYSPITPSVLAKCIYLNEAGKRMELSELAAGELRRLRREIVEAIGVER
jgi:hypothetical protein